ncbi:MAG: response regulator [Chitinophagaceae bacterium]|nr:response regulator [Chitinophagaceae bacterium]
MSKKIYQKLPFFIIVSFSLLVMMAILFAQYESQKSIRLLKSENLQAFKIIQVNNIMGDIINEVYMIDEVTGKYVVSNNIDLYQHIQDTVSQLQKDVQKIQELVYFSENNKTAISALTRLIDRKIEPLKRITSASDKSEKQVILSQLTTKDGLKLTDSIYLSALTIQYELEKNLEKSIKENEVLSTRVLFISWVLGCTSILAIVILASIIIQRLLRNYNLIKDLHLAKMQIEQQSLVKEQFLANMSHEIRTPINSVIGFTNLLQKTELRDDQQQFVNLIKTAGQNLLGIVNDILDISKIEAGMLHFDKNPFNMKECCYTMEMMYYHQFSEKKLSSNFSLSPDVPLNLIGDKERLAQILNNLINNAIKFTKEGGVSVSAELVSKNGQKARIRFSVADTGIGIMPEKLGKIFDRFEQAENDTTRNYGGTGLGLSIVKSLIDLQGGSIFAESEPGKGTQFIFELDFGIEETNELNSFISAAPQNLIPSKNHMALENVRILVAEDNKMNQMLLRFVLEQWKVRYDFAGTGQEALDNLKKGQYDIVLMDIQMPVMDGYTATEMIRSDLQSNIPVIAMTANVLPGEKEKCKKAGMNDYISKPLNESILYDLLVSYSKSENSTDALEQSTPLLIDKQYLHRIFSGNEEFIKEIIEQFLLQFPKEITELEHGVKNRDINKVRQQSHHMKTTLSTVNNKSPLLDHLADLEMAEDNSSYWDVIQHKMNIISASRSEMPA